MLHALGKVQRCNQSQILQIHRHETNREGSELFVSATSLASRAHARTKLLWSVFRAEPKIISALLQHLLCITCSLRVQIHSKPSEQAFLDLIGRTRIKQAVWVILSPVVIFALLWHRWCQVELYVLASHIIFTRDDTLAQQGTPQLETLFEPCAVLRIQDLVGVWRASQSPLAKPSIPWPVDKLLGLSPYTGRGRLHPWGDRLQAFPTERRKYPPVLCTMDTCFWKIWLGNGSPFILEQRNGLCGLFSVGW